MRRLSHSAAWLQVATSPVYYFLWRYAPQLLHCAVITSSVCIHPCVQRPSFFFLPLIPNVNCETNGLMQNCIVCARVGVWVCGCFLCVCFSLEEAAGGQPAQSNNLWLVFCVYMCLKKDRFPLKIRTKVKLTFPHYCWHKIASLLGDVTGNKLFSTLTPTSSNNHGSRWRRCWQISFVLTFFFFPSQELHLQRQRRRVIGVGVAALAGGLNVASLQFGTPNFKMTLNFFFLTSLFKCSNVTCKWKVKWKWGVLQNVCGLSVDTHLLVPGFLHRFFLFPLFLLFTCRHFFFFVSLPMFFCPFSLSHLLFSFYLCQCHHLF